MSRCAEYMELQRYKEKGEKIDIEFVAYGAGLNMMRNDNSPLKERWFPRRGLSRRGSGALSNSKNRARP